MILVFVLLKKNFVSCGSSEKITTLALWHCACAEFPDEIKPFTISSGKLWSILIVPQKMNDKVEFDKKF